MSDPDPDIEYFDNNQVVHIVTTNDQGHEVHTPIWAVVVRGRVYIRAAYGPASIWFSRVVRTHAAEFADGDRRIPATVEAVLDPDTLDRVDQAYLEKYSGPESPVEAILAAGPRGDTLLVTPQVPHTPATGPVPHS